MNGIIDRLPPANIEAEEAVLGSCLVDPNATALAAIVVRPADFFRDAHRILFQAACELMESAQPVDVVTVSERLRQTEQYDAVGGLAYLSDLVAAVATSLHVEHYARLVADAASRRRLIQATGMMAQWAYDQERPLTDVMAVIWQELAKAMQSVEGSVIRAPEDRADTLVRLVADVGERRAAGISTGIADLDRALHGLRAGQFVVVAARPSVGKTALLHGICRHVARHAGPVLLCSAEMSDEELVTRDAASAMRRDWRSVERAIASGTADGQLTAILNKARDAIADLRLYVYYNPRMTTADVRSRASEMRAKHSLAMIAVDYLQLLKDADGGRDNDNVRVARISGNLKAIAGEFRVPILVASQLSRQVEHRTPPIPELADLRDSGAVEQDADVVLGLYRADRYYTPESDDHRGGKVEKGMARLEVLKQRGGPAPIILPLRWVETLCEYASPAESDDKRVSPKKSEPKEIPF